MKYLITALLFWTGAQAAPLPQVQPPAKPPVALRQAVEQYRPDSASTPRRLSPVERAELRRQLSEFGQPANPVVQRGSYEQVPARSR